MYLFSFYHSLSPFLSLSFSRPLSRSLSISLSLFFSLSLILSVFHSTFRFHRFEEAMSLFENMQTNFLDKDIVTYMNGVRAAGFCRPWSSSLKILKECSSHLGGENVLPVVNTIITNLKYHDRLSVESSTSVVKAQEMLFWILTQGLQPSTQTMVITYFIFYFLHQYFLNFMKIFYFWFFITSIQ